MEELTALLNKIEDSYYDFVSFVLHYAGRKASHLDVMLSYLKEHPQALSSDVLKFLSDQEDIYEDAAYMKAV